MACDEHDQPEDGLTIKHLAAPELFCLTCLRLWVEECLEKQRPGTDWRDGFAQAGIPSSSVHAFDMFMTIVSKTALRPIDVRQSTCQCMSQDEARFLGMIAAVQAGCFPMFQNLLGEWVPVTAIRAATMPISMLAGALDACSLRLPPTTKSAKAETFQANMLARMDQGSQRIH